MSKKDNQPPNPEWFSVDSELLLPKDNTTQLLRHIPLFRDLSNRNWREISNMFHERSFKKDEIIFKEGTPGLGMYIVVDGAVRIIGEVNDQIIELASLVPGQFFGEMTLIDNTDRSATALATEPTRLIGIFRPQLKDLMNRRPRLGMTILVRLAEIIVFRLRTANRYLAECQADLQRLSSHD